MTEKIESKTSLLQRLRNRSLVQDTRGLNTVEYAILLVLIVIASYGLWSTFGEKIYEGVDGANRTVDLSVEDN